jgi:hypothetical protein
MNNGTNNKIPNPNPDSYRDQIPVLNTLYSNPNTQLMIMAATIDSRIEPHPISHDDFNSGNPFVVEIKKTGKEIAA